MIRLVTIICLISFGGLQAQKVIKKSIVNTNVSSFQIDTANCFELELIASATDELLVEAAIDGEYSEDLIVKINQAGSTYLISAGFRPNFIIPNDKLGAHKVVSIALRISLPAFTKVDVTGTNCDVRARGMYSFLKVVSDDGQCTLNQVGQNTIVKTQSGHINLLGEGGNVIAASKYGKVINEYFPEGENDFSLHSITGNIRVINTN